MSTDKDEQFTSYEAQVEYYTDYTRRNPDWDFVKVYTDEGITGTSTKKRDGFNEMVNDALAGKIDLIVTKSVSRFARNTVDSLVTIRDLKAHGVEVYFEKENIYTFDGKGELLLTIMSSIAQEESRSISENVTWGHRKRFADGKILMSYKHFLGYERGEDGNPVINAKEAEIVRSIYRMFMEGKTPFAIAKALEKKKVPTPMGKAHWSDSTIINILTNEKYKRDALLQKKFTVDYLTKKTKKNEGEVPQYYVQGSHPAIIDPREWEAVQSEFAHRKSVGKAYSGTSVFSSRLVCSDCGDFFGSKVWHSTDAYRKEIWRCNHKFGRDRICNTPHLTAQQIQTMFLRAYNELMQDRTQIIADCAMLRELVLDCSKQEKAIAEVEREMAVTATLVAASVKENATTVQEQDEYNRKFAELEAQYNAQKAKKGALQAEISDMVTWILDKVRDFGGKLIDAVKKVFGIASPSRVFADQIGRNLGLGVGLGFEDVMEDVSKDMANAIPTDFDVAANVHGVSETATGSGGGISLTLNIENFHNYRAEDISELADELSVILASKMNRKAAAF